MHVTKTIHLHDREELTVLDSCLVFRGAENKGGELLQVYFHPSAEDITQLRRHIGELHGARHLRACLYCREQPPRDGADCHEVQHAGDFFLCHDLCIARQSKADSEDRATRERDRLESHRRTARRGRRWLRAIRLLRFFFFGRL